MTFSRQIKRFVKLIYKKNVKWKEMFKKILKKVENCKLMSRVKNFHLLKCWILFNTQRHLGILYDLKMILMKQNNKLDFLLSWCIIIFCNISTNFPLFRHFIVACTIIDLLPICKHLISKNYHKSKANIHLKIQHFLQ